MACQLVLLYTLVQSSFVAAPAPKTPIRSNSICKLGAAATYCFARLLVARANRAVTVFVVAFNVAFAVFILSFRYSPFRHSHRTATPRKSCPPFVRPVTLYFLISSSPCLFQRTLQTKTPPALRQSRWQSKPSLRSGLPSSATLAPLADGSRLSTTLAKKLLRFCSACFLPLRSGSRLLYLFSV